MKGALRVLNRQRTRPVDGRLLRTVTLDLLSEFLSMQDFDISIQLVNARSMTQLNEQHLRHAGVTDVISFEYSGTNSGDATIGDIFVCVDEAIAQARRFRGTWQAELVRYVIHGLLHLRGHDDKHPAARRRMKREEDRLLRALAGRHRLSRLERK